MIKMPIEEIIEKYKFMAGFFEENDTVYSDKSKSPKENIESLTEEQLEDLGVDYESVLETLNAYFDTMKEFLGIEEEKGIESLSLLAGQNKFGEKENYEKITMDKGDVIAIVGPTGSGKSRLLQDIEWIADGDTPTKRGILINGEKPDKSMRYNSSNKLVAQLSQNMNFVMDLSVEEFLELHGKSRLVENLDDVVKKIIIEANTLAGEKFDLSTPITSLSGGQSRALMIADTAILSKSPIVLIDEIENAGIDRKEALKLLVKEDKIVLIATHDPILALSAEKRIVIKNGGIHKIIETSQEERDMLGELEEIDRYLMDKRQKIRAGEKLV